MIMANPRLCFVGAVVAGKPGWVTTQGAILASLFKSEGWDVKATSAFSGRIPRLFDIATCLARWRTDIDIAVVSVHTGPGFALADFTIRELRLLGIPAIAVLRAGGLPAFAARHPTWVRRGLSRADQIVTPSTFLAAQLEASQILGPASNSAGTPIIIPNTIVLDRYDYRDRAALAPRMLWMRTFQDTYNPEMAVHALFEVRKKHPDATLTMAGQDRGLLDATKSLVRDLSLESVVKFAGFLDPEAKRTAFNSHDIFLHTNRVDNTPVSVIEAAAAGLGIVATRVGGIPHLLDDGTNALLVEDEDANAMAASVDQLLTVPELAPMLTTNARSVAEQCSWPVVRDAWTDLFDQVLGARKS